MHEKNPESWFNPIPASNVQSQSFLALSATGSRRCWRLLFVVLKNSHRFQTTVSLKVVHTKITAAEQQTINEAGGKMTAYCFEFRSERVWQWRLQWDVTGGRTSLLSTLLVFPVGCLGGTIRFRCCFVLLKRIVTFVIFRSPLFVLNFRSQVHFDRPNSAIETTYMIVWWLSCFQVNNSSCKWCKAFTEKSLIDALSTFKLQSLNETLAPPNQGTCRHKKFCYTSSASTGYYRCHQRLKACVEYVPQYLIRLSNVPFGHMCVCVPVLECLYSKLKRR